MYNKKVYLLKCILYSYKIVVNNKVYGIAVNIIHLRLLSLCILFFHYIGCNALYALRNHIYHQRCLEFQQFLAVSKPFVAMDQHLDLLQMHKIKPIFTFYFAFSHFIFTTHTHSFNFKSGTDCLVSGWHKKKIISFCKNIQSLIHFVLNRIIKSCLFHLSMDEYNR